MSVVEVSAPAVRPPRAWPFALAGLIGVGLAAALRWSGLLTNPESSRAESWLLAAQLVLLAAGLLAAGVAVVLRPRSALVLAADAAAAGLASYAVAAECDSLRLVLRVTTLVAAVSAGLVLLPRSLGRGVVSLVIVFHFSGILTAVLSVAPPGAPPPWLTSQLWTYVFRPYLQFMYLNNAYHFYSPEPGPATLLWCQVDYSDGNSRWIDLPNRGEHVTDPMGLSYYRRLVLAESTSQVQAPAEPSPEVLQRRLLGGTILGIPTPAEISPFFSNVPQYRVPNDYSWRALRGYARHLARANPPTDPAVRITGIKIYRVVHVMLLPGQLLSGEDPADPALYLPYYQGEFDAEGQLKNPADPFLFWLIPILTVPRPGASDGSEVAFETQDYLTIHARSRRTERGHE
jgi:hypothetical protein